MNSAPIHVEAVLVMVGWHGTSKQRVIVVGQTPRRFRIRAIEDTQLAGRGRTLPRGQETLVPKTAIYGDDGKNLIIE